MFVVTLFSAFVQNVARLDQMVDQLNAQIICIFHVASAQEIEQNCLKLDALCLHIKLPRVFFVLIGGQDINMVVIYLKPFEPYNKTVGPLINLVWFCRFFHSLF